jgi:hypothetical protein
MALVFFGIRVSFKVDELQSSSAWHEPFGPLFVVFSADFGEELLCPSDDFRKLFELPADENADSGFAVESSVLEPVTDRGFSFPTTSGTAVKYLEDWALDECRLRTFLRRPDDGLVGTH